MLNRGTLTERGIVFLLFDEKILLKTKNKVVTKNEHILDKRTCSKNKIYKIKHDT